MLIGDTSEAFLDFGLHINTANGCYRIRHQELIEGETYSLKAKSTGHIFRVSQTYNRLIEYGSIASMISDAQVRNTALGFGEVVHARYFSPEPAAITPPSAVPLPAAAWLFGSGLLGLIGVGRKHRR